MTPKQYKAARTALGMTQAKLAETLDITRKTVSARETTGATISEEASRAILSIKPKTKTK